MGWKVIIDSDKCPYRELYGYSGSTAAQTNLMCKITCQTCSEGSCPRKTY